MKTEPDKAGEFFTGYASEFDDIYDVSERGGVVGWVNRVLRKTMAIRFTKTFETLQPMPGRSVLDVGCGSGRYIVPALHMGASRVVGIDLSQAMLDLAGDQARQEAERCEGTVELLCGDFLSTPIGQPLDYAIVMGVMDYVSDAAAFLGKLKDSFTEKAVISFPVSENIWKWQRKVRYHLRGCPLHFYRRKRLEKLLADTAVASYTVEKADRDYFVTLCKY